MTAGQRLDTWKRGRLRLLHSRFAEQMPHNARTIAQAAWEHQHYRLHGEAGPVLPARARLAQVDFGWEICSTGGARERFRVDAYKLTGRAR
jgi:hypothetical protein